MTKKKISVIALDPRAGKSYGEDIAGLFSDVADISVFSMLDGSAAGVLERADLFVASTDAYGSPEELAKHIPLDSQTMAIEVSFRWSELRKLKELPAGSKVLFVNMTETMAREAIAQLEQFGITHIHWIPFYPGASLEEDVHIAVTPDEMRYVPPKMETVIDIGQRVCTSGMMIEIALRLGLESLLEGPAFQEYARSVATSNYRPISNRLQPAITALTRCLPGPSVWKAYSIFYWRVWRTASSASTKRVRSSPAAVRRRI